MAIEKDPSYCSSPARCNAPLVGEIISIFEKKGLHLCGMKMMMLTDELLSEHYAHLSEKPFFQRVKDSMMTAPVVALCLQGVDAIAAVRALAGPTNGRHAAPRHHPRQLLHELPREHRACLRLSRNGSRGAAPLLPR